MRKASSPRFWARAVVAGGACVLALTTTGAMVRAAVVPTGTGSAIAVLTDQGQDGQGNQGGQGGQGGQVWQNDQGGNVDAGWHGWSLPPLPAIIARLKAAMHKPAPTPPAHKTPPKQSHPARSAEAGRTTTHMTHVTAAAPAPKVVVDASDPVLFSAQTVAATDAARVLPVESLGPLTGISFGSGLFIWPILVAVDVIALAIIARMALHRRRVSPGD
jgi:hypothetical protein